MFISFASFLLLPGIVHSYSLFDFNRKPNNDDIKERRGSIVADQKENIPPSNPPSRKNSIPDHDPFGHHSPLPPTESTLSTGLFHTCAIVRRAGVDCGKHSVCGPAKCWGHDHVGQSTPPPGVMFTQLSAGGSFTCGLKMDGKVACWGDIDHPPKSLESLSREERSDVRHARRLQQEAEGWRGGTTVQHENGGGYNVQVSSGMRHACAISRDSEVHCWGRDDYGEGSPPSRAFVQVSAGHSFTCGIRPNGAVECWGKNDMGQSSPPPYPKNIFQKISTSLGSDHACGILLEDGDIRCWGNNGRGQSENQDGNFLQVSAGTRTSCALREETEAAVDDGDSDVTSTTIHCWGSRANSVLDQLVMKEQTNEKSHDHNQISLGQDHACASGKSADESSDSAQTSLECWWMAGSDFNAHRIPVGLEMAG